MSSESKSSFFKQSGWMVVATFMGGIFMTFVHTVAKKMPTGDYSVFVTLLRVLVVLGIPAAALQAVFAQQAAMATTDQANRDLIATTRGMLKVTFGAWLVLALAMFAATKPISNLLKISNPVALWFTITLALTMLWIPIFRGVLQGQHHFGGLGWLQITDGVGRFAMMIVAIGIMHFASAGGMFAALFGQLVTVAVGAWLTRKVWLSKEEGKFSVRAWIKEAAPLTFGSGIVILMSSMDMLFVQSIFPDEDKNGLYGGAMLTGFAIVQFIAPITSVMFSKIARSRAHSQKSNTLPITIAITATFGAIAAIGCTLLPELPLKVIYSRSRDMWAAAPLVPWFGWALLPLTISNVLIQNILARGQYNAIRFLVFIPIAYIATLALLGPKLLAMPNVFDAFKMVIGTLGCYCLLLCVIASLFTFRKS